MQDSVDGVPRLLGHNWDSDMEEMSAPAKQNRLRDIISVIENSLDLETSEQMGGGGQREGGGTQSTECSLAEGSACDLGFGVEQAGAEAVEMDGDLWGELPEHLMDNILAKLPVLSFLRLRSVCKKWNALVSDPLVLENCSRTQSSGSASASPLFLLYADRARQSYCTYDPSLNTWYLLPQTVNNSSPGSSSSSFVVLAAAGGLLCLTDTLFRSGEAINLYVSNPMTRARRRLPPMIRMSKSYIVRMVADTEKNTYKIVVVLPREHLTLQVYDSTTNSWEMVGGVLNRHRHAMRVGTTYSQGVLYGLAGWTGISVSAYHMDRGVWEDLHAPMPAALTCPQLFVSRGNLMLVGAIPVNGIIRSVCVWQLDSVQLEWVEVLTVPDDLLSGLSRGGRLGFYNFFVAGGDYICFAHFRDDQLLMCNVVKKSWWWLPLCPFDTGEGAPNLSRFPRNLSGFPLQPSLVASV